MKTTCLSDRRIQLAQQLLRYDFKINNCLRFKNPAGVLSRLITYEDAEKRLVGQNRKILNKLQHFLSQNIHSLLHVNCQAVTQSTICDEENYF